MDRGTDTQLADFLARHRRLAVLTGAGISTASGIPDYRADDGSFKHARPVQYADFVGDAATRRRYWARSFVGWRRVRGAEPNAGHRALAALGARGTVGGLITQNVDDLHRRAGSAGVIDLHGVLRRIRCLDCDATTGRDAYQAALAAANPGWRAAATGVTPDGDARLDVEDFDGFVVPDCRHCGGTVKPDVVFFGESVPAPRVATATGLVASADALLVVGSSLMVYSGFRFVRQASAAGVPIAIVNRGLTRADELATARFHEDCGTLLEATLERLDAPPVAPSGHEAAG